MRHDEIRDTFAAIMKDVCFDVEIEPKLQPLEGESFVHKTTTTEDEASRIPAEPDIILNYKP